MLHAAAHEIETPILLPDHLRWITAGPLNHCFRLLFFVFFTSEQYNQLIFLERYQHETNAKQLQGTFTTGKCCVQSSTLAYANHQSMFPNQQPWKSSSPSLPSWGNASQLSFGLWPHCQAEQWRFTYMPQNHSKLDWNLRILGFTHLECNSQEGFLSFGKYTWQLTIMLVWFPVDHEIHGDPCFTKCYKDMPPRYI